MKLSLSPKLTDTQGKRTKRERMKLSLSPKLTDTQGKRTKREDET